MNGWQPSQQPRHQEFGSGLKFQFSALNAASKRLFRFILHRGVLSFAVHAFWQEQARMALAPERNSPFRHNPHFRFAQTATSPGHGFGIFVWYYSGNTNTRMAFTSHDNVI
jgi:hypothetical protein